MCVCVCGGGGGGGGGGWGGVIYPGGDLKLNTHRLMRTESRWGPKLRSPWVQKLINHTELVFFLRK